MWFLVSDLGNNNAQACYRQVVEAIHKVLAGLLKNKLSDVTNLADSEIYNWICPGGALDNFL